MIDEDLAALYGVPTKRLNQQVQRNRKRFPEDFMFQLTKEEAKNLRLQIATSSFECYLDFVFTRSLGNLSACLTRKTSLLLVSIFPFNSSSAGSI